MNSKSNIDRLLTKYWDGETDLNEEQILRTYFTSEDVHDEHRDDREIFNTLSTRSDLTMPNKYDSNYWTKKAASVPQQKARIWSLRKWSIAASFALLIGAGGYLVQQQWTAVDTSTVASAEEAVIESQKALLFLVEQFGIGEKATSEVVHLKTLGNTLQ